MVLVDSSVWIEAARRQGDLGCKVALESLLEEYEAAWCSPVRLEVMGGARKEERRGLAASSSRKNANAFCSARTTRRVSP